MQPVQQRRRTGAQVPQEPMRRRISNFLAHTVDRFRIALLGGPHRGGGVPGRLLHLHQVNKKLVSDSTRPSRRSAQDLYDKWQAETDATKKAALEKDLLGPARNAVISRYPRQYGGQRGLFIRAELNYAKKAWDAALEGLQDAGRPLPEELSCSHQPVRRGRVPRGEGRRGQRAEAVRAGIHRPTRTPPSPRAPFSTPGGSTRQRAPGRTHRRNTSQMDTPVQPERLDKAREEPAGRAEGAWER